MDAVAQVTKTGFTFLFDRVTGKPLFPIEEVPAPKSQVPGEVSWPTILADSTAAVRAPADGADRRVFGLLKALPINVDTSDIWATADLQSQARRWNLAAYDAAYLDLALRRRVPLAAADDDLKRAALAEGVQIINPAPPASAAYR